MPDGTPLGACPLKGPFMPELRVRNDVECRLAPALVSEGALRHVWDSLYGTIVIEVNGEEVFVNGQRVEPHGTRGTRWT